MKKIVAYDICHPRRLKKVAKTCELYGVRIEKSVFECDLEEEVFEQFWEELLDIIKQEEDSIVAYSICRTCARNILSVGSISRPVKHICYYAGI